MRLKVMNKLTEITQLSMNVYGPYLHNLFHTHELIKKVKCVRSL